MYLVLVSLMVRPEFLEAFLVATLEMAHESLKEDGTRRFEVIRQENDPALFMLYETFNSRADFEFHVKTPHVKAWHKTVRPMLAGPVQENSYTQLF
jgi:(4S)-4-hydroxy-5-phosphonooxypentane-2,3-dione isomerase